MSMLGRDGKEPDFLIDRELSDHWLQRKISAGNSRGKIPSSFRGINRRERFGSFGDNRNDPLPLDN